MGCNHGYARRLGGVVVRGAALLALVGLSLQLAGPSRGSPGIVPVMTSKSIPPATVSVIDPESGTSSGGGTTDVNVGIGDVILFRMTIGAIPENSVDAVQAYITDYIPANTEVVGIRIVDASDLTIWPNYPGFVPDDCGENCNFGAVNDNLPRTGTNNKAVADGSILQLYSDTGIFWSVDPLLLRNPSTAFLTMENGYLIGSGNADEPIFGDSLAPLLSKDNSAYYSHNTWDLMQVFAFGTANAAAGTAGGGNTPRFYGSPVAGPDTHYPYGVTFGDNVGTNPCAAQANPHHYCTDTYGDTESACDFVTNRCREIAFDDVNGPWSRIRYPGSTTTTLNGIPTGKGGAPLRSVVDVGTGYDISPRNPLVSKVNPATTCTVRADCNTVCGGAYRCQCVDEGGGNRYCYKNATATRWALGEMRVGENVTVEIALRVLGTPLDPIMNKDSNCAGVQGAEIASSDTNSSGTNNPWGFFVPAPSCVYLNLLFDLTVDKLLAAGGDPLRYTIKGKNLSINPQTNAYARILYPGNTAFLAAGTTPGYAVTTCGGKACLQWSLGTLAPSAEYEIVANFTVGGIGNNAATMYANYVSDQLPSPGFTTQAVTAVKPLGSPKLSLYYYSPSTFVPTTGGTAQLRGTLSNVGTDSMTGVSFRVYLPTGFTMAAGSTIGGSALTCGAPSGGYATCTGLPTMAEGDSREIRLNITVPNGTATGLYGVDLAVLVTLGAQWKNIERYLRSGVAIPVGQARAAAPVITCPVDRLDAAITGTSTENGGRVRVYFNGVERGTGTYTVTVTGGTWSLPVAEWLDEFGNLYAGLEIRATVDGASTNVSPLSTACFVTSLPVCSNGRDDDLDGLTDFPADPGCASATGGSEVDPATVQCNDGLDNDGDGLIDWPYDGGCASATSNDENGINPCTDGLDNDGDGLVDAADPGCAASSNHTELDLAACQNFKNDDGAEDTLKDFPADPGCHSAFDNDEHDFTFSEDPIKARLLIAFDTSGSMNWNTCSPIFTGGDGSASFPGSDVSCAVCGPSGNGCGDGVANDSRMWKVKAGITDAVSAYGSVDWGLMRFHQRPMTFGAPTSNASLKSGGWQGAGLEPCGGGFNAGDLLVGFAPENIDEILDWMDGTTNYGNTGNRNPPPGFDKELRGSGTTPLAGILLSAREYISDTQDVDPKNLCRPYRVILVTDGGETCGGDPAGAAGLLYGTDDVKVHVIGFATSDASIIEKLNGIALAGGTSSAVFADDSVELSSAIGQIISESILVERCNELDDNCNGLIDEDFPDKGTVCDNGLKGVCLTLGHRQCRADELGTECVLDSTPLAPSTEVCDGLDNDCDGFVDNHNACVIEYCNGVDDYGNGFVKPDGSEDPRVGQPCGSSVGECTIGVTVCVAGSIECNGVQPTTEICDALDQDCDGINNNGVPPRSCSITVAGVGTCTGLEVCDSAGNWVNCSAQTPQVEVCDGYDNDCDGSIDENLGSTSCGQGRCAHTVQNCIGGVPQFCDPFEGAIAETCNNVDDDCDGTVDDGLGSTTCGLGACEHTVPNCVGGVTQVCNPLEGVASEVCDNVDNDCDGSVDENLTQSCYTGPAGTSGVGLCHAGSQTCASGNWGGCTGQVTPTTEVCDGADNDCDGSIDENLGSTSCGLGACFHTVQNCVGGVPQTCNPLQGAAAETCDGADNDCDGVVDGLTRECFSAGSGNGCTYNAGTGAWTCRGVCTTGTDECAEGGSGAWSGCVGDRGPGAETCNGLDDDCDGSIDETAAGTPITAVCYPPGYGPGRGCTAEGVCAGQCHEGTRTCTNGSYAACIGAVTPGVEVCDGVDNDCDGLIDEDAAGNPLSRACNNGACTGTETCTGGTWSACSAPTPGAEVCDNADNNCDGQIDENVTRSCYSGPAGTQGVGACHGGLQTCVAGVFGACVGEVVPQVETCDGLDNDCDGTVDEDAAGNPLVQVCYTGPTGTSGHGECKQGLRVCQGGAWTACQGEVVPATEVCDGKDNDCDNVVDDGFGSTSCGLGECAHTVQDCLNGNPQVCNPLEGAAPELCDGLDNDCDGVADGLTRTCYEFASGCTYDATAMTWNCLGVCGTGTQQCPVGSAAWGECVGDRGPGVETCNGFDDDCDGTTDEDAAGNPLSVACYPAGYGANTGCTATGDCRGACHEGARTCTGGAFGACTGAVTPATEVCDGVDNDCDGQVDENLTRACQNTNGSGTCTGTQTCGAGTWSTCTAAVPAAEVCDGVDNDCDGSIDENLTRSCYTGAAGTQGVGACRAGTETCTAAAWGACVGQVVPQTETCDGVDNDCDGTVDEGPDGQPLSQACYTGPAGTQGVGECHAGVRTCVNGAWTSCTGEAIPRTETCNGRDDDCDAQTDEGLGTTTCGLGACQHTVNNCEGGSPVICDPLQGATVETCDGVDNDCDGTVDGLARTCYPGGATGCVETPAGSGNWTCQGSCAVGIDVCAQGSGGAWSGCQYAVTPTLEQCDNVDNDCDGLTDEDDLGGPLSQSCYSPGSVLSSGCTLDATGIWSCLGECHSGVRTCTTGAWGLCVGEVTPSVERCNGLDDDCNGLVDDDIPGVGQDCGTALGRCTPGVLACVDGSPICEGGTGPFPGECNSQDDDCDGEIDEADEVAAVEGQPCGNPEGSCVAGQTMCVGGQVICTGEVLPTPEVCDGVDNDCDGDVDNEAPCPVLYHCYQADCRRECDPLSEFPCPVGLTCVQVTLDGSVVEDLCVPGGACGGVICPDGWVCQDDECVNPCDPNPCDWWQQCDKGNCIDRSCTALGFECTGTDICVNHECVPDPCLTATCDPTTQVCNPSCDETACEPACEPLCLCPEGQRCDGQGGCEVDPCVDVQCGPGLRCDPDSGGCDTDPCAYLSCDVGDVCFEGTCIADPCRQIHCPPYFSCEVYREPDGNGGYTADPICQADPDYYVPGTGKQKFLATGAGGCACQTPGEGRGTGILFLLTALLLFWRRRRAQVRVARDGEVA